jgi:hypothetical protein
MYAQIDALLFQVVRDNAFVLVEARRKQAARGHREATSGRKDIKSIAGC